MIPEIPSTLGSQPVSPENPQGIAARYEPEYEELQEEVRKLQSLSGGSVEWSRVAELAVVILGTKSKDLQVASYLCVALLHEQSLKGLAAGLLTCKDLLSNYWETMFPELKRLKGRVAAIEWLSENTAKELGVQRFGSSDKQQLEQIQDTIKQVISLLEEKVQGKNNFLSELSRKVKEIISDLSSQTVAEESKPKSAAQPTAASQASSPAPAKISSEADARKALREAQSIILKTAAYLRKADPKNPLPYRLSRSVLWDSIQVSPPNTGGRTQMPAIPAYTMDAQKQLLEKGEPEAIVAQFESTFTSSPFLLDLQHHLDEALSSLGTPYKEVQSVIREELGVFLRRIPQLLDIQFQDGTDFANSETREWIKKTVLSQAGAGEEPQAGGQSEEGRELEETYNKARQLTRTKQIKEAISLFQDKLARTPERRERFIWNFHLAKVLMVAGKQNLALAQLESLDREIEIFSLEEWEPELCQDVLSQLIICQKKVAQETHQNTPEIKEKLSRLNARLFGLSPISALAIDGKA